MKSTCLSVYSLLIIHCVSVKSSTDDDLLVAKLTKLMEERFSHKLSNALNRIDSLERQVERLNNVILLSEKYNNKSDGITSDDDQLTRITVVDSWNKLNSIPRSCQEARSTDPSLQSGNYYIDPDGTNVGDDPISVYCDMTTGTTMVGHDSEATIDVGNCNNPGCYSRTINYVNGATTKQLVALIDISTSCRQSIRYDCFNAPLEFSGVQESWWNDRSGVQRYFWAGPYNNDQHTCQCGIDKNCVDPSQKCNCDAMAIVQLNDNGYVTAKNLLPVTRLNFGRIVTGSNGKHTLGKFECSGRTTLTSMPTSCRDLFIAGNQINGFYTIKRSSTQISTVYCDFSKAPDAQGYEKLIGFNDVKTNSGIYFFVQRSTVYTSIDTVIPYDVEVLNIGKAINLTTGIFTVPTRGRYLIIASALSNVNSETRVQLRVNRAVLTESFGVASGDQMPISITLQLNEGDVVDTYLLTGSLNNNAVERFSQFSAILLEEDLVL